MSDIMAALGGASVIGGKNADQGSATGALTGGSVMGKEEFLNLLVTQIQHQDPLEPMDNEQFVAQMAQFSSLEQMMNLNETMGRVEMLEASVNNSQAVNLIGKNISVVGNTIQMNDGTATQVHYGLDSDAENVEISVFDDVGRLVRSINLGSQDAGRHDFQFDGMDEYGTKLQDGEYTFEISAKDADDDSVEVTTLSDVRVDGLVFADGVVYLLAGESRFLMSDVYEVTSPLEESSIPVTDGLPTGSDAEGYTYSDGTFVQYPVFDE